jgi:hypothetical protein
LEKEAANVAAAVQPRTKTYWQQGKERAPAMVEAF